MNFDMWHVAIEEVTGDEKHPRRHAPNRVGFARTGSTDSASELLVSLN
jgi:hypothetical protein